ncbi:hypothetical protein [Endozoicomonas numazuensis]|uniref:hypothetical protein n=1 Tax=Endozoicomonas numazuensis TaxID=1137799 RepID=UPI000690F767|nr:hypothetical protein [Endozoicomonas numazuensis]
MIRKLSLSRFTLACGIPSILASAVAFAQPNMPPANAYLADSPYPITHVTSAQQGAVDQLGPVSDSRRLSDQEIQYQYIGPNQLIVTLSGQYPDGRRVLWSAGADRVVKQDYDSFEMIDSFMTREDQGWDSEWAEERERKVSSGFEPLRIINAIQEMYRFAEAGSLYPLIDKDNRFYLGRDDGNIVAYGDKVEGDPSSPIEQKYNYKIAAPVTGRVTGINMSYDGYLIAVTDDGWVVAMSRDFKQQYQAKLNFAPEQSQNKDDPLNGWVRNSFAVDEKGLVYIASTEHMHAIKWTGNGWSKAPEDGAWSAPYSNSKGRGTGSTPSLMGFGDEDKLVAITDGDDLMNLTLFWREAIPETWKGLPGEDRRVAGKIAANMGNPDLKEVQSEQSVAVYGYGAVIVNNEPPSLPFYLPNMFAPVFAGLLANEDEYRPLGIQKFQWNPENRTLEEAWVNVDVSSPNSVPIISAQNNILYTAGTRDGEWTMEAIDWTSGKEKFHWILGPNKYNTNFAPIAIDPEGRLTYDSTWGRVRLNPEG